MSTLINRKIFLSLAALGGTGLLLPSPIASYSQPKQKPDPLEKELVKEFVIKGHGDLNRVKELLEKEPGLLNASWDWGGGDFETAIEGAGHVGNKDIAEFLLQKGARMNIFCAAMLGRLDIVKSTLTLYPDLKFSKGPHGLQLLHHAKKGGEGALAALEYLQSIGAQ
jgi:ankyrin repeat protein